MTTLSWTLGEVGCEGGKSMGLYSKCVQWQAFVLAVVILSFLALAAVLYNC